MPHTRMRTPSISSVSPSTTRTGADIGGSCRDSGQQPDRKKRGTPHRGHPEDRPSSRPPRSGWRAAPLAAGNPLRGKASGDEALVWRGLPDIGRSRCGSLSLDLREQPGLHCGGGAFSFRTVMREAARLQDDRTQLGDAAAPMIVEMHERKPRARHRILQDRDRRRRRQAMLAAQMQKSADEAVAAVAVIVTAARPAPVIGEKREHQVEQLYGLAGFGFQAWGWSLRVRDYGLSVAPAAAARTAALLRQTDRFDQRRIVVPDIADPRAHGPAHHAVGRVGGQQRLQFRYVRRFLAEPGRPRLRLQHHGASGYAAGRTIRSAPW